MEETGGKSYTLSPSVHTGQVCWVMKAIIWPSLPMLPPYSSLLTLHLASPGFLERGAFSAQSQMTPFVPTGHYHIILTSVDRLEMDLWLSVRDEESNFRVEIVPRVKYFQDDQGGYTNYSNAWGSQCSINICWTNAWREAGMYERS